MTILHFKVVLAAIFININIDNRKIRPYSQFYNLITSKYVPLKMSFFQEYKYFLSIEAGNCVSNSSSINDEKIKTHNLAAQGLALCGYSL